MGQLAVFINSLVQKLQNTASAVTNTLQSQNLQSQISSNISSANLSSHMRTNILSSVADSDSFVVPVDIGGTIYLIHIKDYEVIVDGTSNGKPRYTI